MRVRYTPLLLSVAALVSVAGIAVAVRASAPAPLAEAEWRRIEKICVANGGYYHRTDGGGACLEASEDL